MGCLKYTVKVQHRFSVLFPQQDKLILKLQVDISTTCLVTTLKLVFSLQTLKKKLVVSRSNFFSQWIV